MTVETPAEVSEFDASVEPQNLSEAFAEYRARIRGGDLGSLPALLGILALVTVFTILRPETFTTAFNFANLINQSAAVIVIAMGLVFVLLLGEIDLSAGYAAGTSAAIMAVTVTQHGWPWYLAILACLITGAVIGLCIGLLVSRLGIPSFVVTLAAFLGLQGLMLIIIGEGGTIPIQDEILLKIMNGNLPNWAGWLLAVLVVAGSALSAYRKSARRRRAGLPTVGTQVWVAKVIGLAVVVLGTTYFLSQERSRNPEITSIMGVPNVVPIILILLVSLSFLLERTAFGRHVYAVGGNTEAARRAGIGVTNLKTFCFIMCSTLAAVAGVLFASRDNSVSPSTGGSTTLLFAVGAAVIGGTSLFGGRGRIRDAILGGLVVAIIINGMALLNQPSGVVFIVTGLVLLLAASVDAISRRRAAATGR